MYKNYRLIGMLTEKDKDSIITSCNKAVLLYAGLKSYDAILGLTDNDLPWKEYAHVYRSHELDALAGNNYSIIYPIKDYKNENRLFLHTKIQKMDSNEVIGVKCRAIEIIDPNIFELVHNLLKFKNLSSKQKHFTVGKHPNKNNLSERQLEVLFLLLRGYSTKNIASRFNISYRTVEKYIDIIKRKFNCRYKGELIEYAIDHGYMNFIPENIPTNKLL